MIREDISKEEYIVKAAKLYGVERVEVEALRNLVRNDLDDSFLKKRNRKVFKLYEKFSSGKTRGFVFDENGVINLDDVDYIVSRKPTTKNEFGRFSIITSDLESYIATNPVAYNIPSKFEKISELNDFVLPQIAKAMDVPSATYYRSRHTESLDTISTNHLTKNFLNDDEVLIHGNRIIKDVNSKNKRKSAKKIASSKIKMSLILESTDKFIQRYYKEYKIPEAEQKETRKEIRKELIKQTFVNKFFVNDDEALENWGLVENTETHRLRLAPLTKFGHSAGVKSTEKGTKHVIVSNGNEDMQSFMAEFGKEEWFRDWIKNSVLTTKFDDCIFNMESESRVRLSEEELSYYKYYFENMMEDVRNVIKAKYDESKFPKRHKLRDKVTGIKNGIKKNILPRRNNHDGNDDYQGR